MRNPYATVPYFRTKYIFLFYDYRYIAVRVLSFCVRARQVYILTVAVNFNCGSYLRPLYLWRTTNLCVTVFLHSP